MCWQCCIFLDTPNTHSSIKLPFGRNHSNFQSCLQSFSWNLCEKYKASVLMRYITYAENHTVAGTSAFLLKYWAAAQHGKPCLFILPTETWIISLNTWTSAACLFWLLLTTPAKQISYKSRLISQLSWFYRHFLLPQQYILAGSQQRNWSQVFNKQ